MAHITKQEQSELLKAKEVLDRFFVGSESTLTVDALFDLAFTEHWKGKDTTWSSEVEKIYERAIRPVFGEVLVSEMTPASIRRWHRRFIKRRTSGNRALSVLSRMFSYGEEYDYVPLGQNPCKAVKPFPETKRGRFATNDELKKILQILREDLPTYKKEVTFLLLLIYTGTRPSVLENAKWNHLKLEVKDDKFYGVLTLRGKSTSATGQDEQVVIPHQGIELIKDLSKESLDRRILGISIPHRYWRSVVARAGCEGLWIRDFRRTFATMAKSTGESMEVIGDLLNHKCYETTMIYAKLTDEKRIDAVARIANTVDALS